VSPPAWIIGCEMGSLTFEPLIPLVWWTSLLTAGLVLLIWYGRGRPVAVPRRRWALILAWMAANFGLVLFVLLNPMWIEPLAGASGKPLLTILIDDSASMAAPDEAVSRGRTRYQAAAQLAKELAGAASDRFEVRAFTFGRRVTPRDLSDLAGHVPADNGTDLTAALRSPLEESRAQAQALVLLSDGIHNGEGGVPQILAAARTARALTCPVYTRTFGGTSVVKDVQVEWRTPQDMAYVGQKIPASVLVRQRGYAGATARVKLLHDGKVVEQRQIALSREETTEIRFQIQQDRAGLISYEVRVDALPGEVSLVNNTALMLLRVVKEPVRVLLLEGKPYWDNKFLVRTLLDDSSIELDSAVRMSSQRIYLRSWKRKAPAAGSGALLQEERQVLTGPQAVQSFLKPERLRQYQVLVLGRNADVFLDERFLGQLRSWLANDGGSLVCYRGQPMAQVSQLLGQVLPLRWSPTRESRFRMSLTDQGRSLHWFAFQQPSSGPDPFAGLPTLATTARPEQPRPLATVLATADVPAPEAAAPAVAYQPYGTGRVVAIEGNGMWRWAFLPPADKKNDHVYRSLWHSLMRWLISGAALLPGQSMALRGDKVVFGAAEPASATLIVRDELTPDKVPAVELLHDGSRRQKVVPVPTKDDPHAFRVVFGKLPEGRYRAHVTGIKSAEQSVETIFDVRNLSDEQLDLQARPDLMARIAQESGGAVLEGNAPADMVETFQRNLDRLHPPQVRRVSLWDRWWVFLFVIGTWTIAWALRRRGGLI
jgi:hypothetical protein